MNKFKGWSSLIIAVCVVGKNSPYFYWGTFYVVLADHFNQQVGDGVKAKDVSSHKGFLVFFAYFL